MNLNPFKRKKLTQDAQYCSSGYYGSQTSQGVNQPVGLTPGAGAKATNFQLGVQPSYPELEAMYFGGSDIASMVVDAMIDEALRFWRKWEHPDPAVVQKIEEAEKQFEIKDVLRKALIDDRLYGGSVIIPIFKATESPEELKKPINLNTIKKDSISLFRHLDRWTVYKVVADLYNPLATDFLRPSYVTLAYGGEPIHLSRMVRLDGKYVPIRIYQRNQWWGKSELLDVYQLIVYLTTVEGVLSDLSTKATFDVLKYAGLKKSVSDPQGKKNLAARMEALNYYKSFSKAIAIDSEDDYQHFETDLRYYVAAAEWFVKRISGITGIPVTRLLGEQPKGMNASGKADNDEKNFIAAVERYREEKITKSLESVDKFFLRNLFGEEFEAINKDLKWSWDVPKFVDETETSTLKNEQMDRIVIALEQGMIDINTAKRILSEEKIFPVLDKTEHQPDTDKEATIEEKTSGAWK